MKKESAGYLLLYVLYLSSLKCRAHVNACTFLFRSLTSYIIMTRPSTSKTGTRLSNGHVRSPLPVCNRPYISSSTTSSRRWPDEIRLLASGWYDDAQRCGAVDDEAQTRVLMRAASAESFSLRYMQGTCFYLFIYYCSS